MISIPSATFVDLKGLILTKSFFITKQQESGGHTKVVTIHGKQNNVFTRTVNLRTEDQSDRGPYLTDKFGNSVEGGALNANYTTVDAVAKVSNTLGNHGYVYGRDFIWQDQGYTDSMDDAIIFEYNDLRILTILGLTNG
jgi:hypothetical protein|tara:strand:- start:9254 stop:9670 length:417 start_codon:yes stop_codon:yes gene_type:complete